MLNTHPLLTIDWQHPRPLELTWIYARQGHVNYEKLYVCDVSKAFEGRDNPDAVGGATAWLNRTPSLTAGSGSASSLTAAGGSANVFSLTAENAPSNTVVQPILEKRGKALVDTNFKRLPFLYRPSMYVKLLASDFGECNNPNLDGRGNNYHQLTDEDLPMGITHISHACSS